MQFVCNRGNKYEIVLTLGRLRKIRERFPLDIFNGQDWQQLMASLSDQLALVWYLVEEQAAEYGVDADQFELDLQGKGVADSAATALFISMENFFQRYDQKTLQQQTKRMRILSEDIVKMSQTPEYQQRVEENIAKTLRESGLMSSNTPPSPESTGTT